MEMPSLEQLLAGTVDEVRDAVQAAGASEISYLRWPSAAVDRPAARVAEWIVSRPGYVPGLMISDGGGTSLFDAGPASRALLALSQKFGSHKAAAWYEALRTGKPTRGLHVWMIQGLVAHKPIALSENVSVVPFADIPRSTMRDEAQGFVLPEDQLSFGHRPTLSRLSAIVEGFDFEQRLIPKNSAFEPSPPQGLHKFLEGLTLVGPSSVRAIRQWAQTADPMFEFIRNGSGFGHHHHDLAWPTGSPVAVLTEGSVKLVRDYVALAENEPQLSVSVQRLNAALRRLNPADKAVELGTALESTFLGTNSPEITYKLSLRAARYLGSTYDERLKIRNMMKKFYSVRSHAIHRGILDPHYKPETPAELATWAQTVLTDCLRRFVQEGRMPSWDEIELS